MNIFKPVLRFGSISTIVFSSSFTAAQTNVAQERSEDEIIVRGIYNAPISTFQDAASLSIIDQTNLQNIAAIHASEALNAVAGVNIQRGSGQESLTAIRSPVLTGGAGAGSFLFLEDGVPLRAAGFANVNGLFEGGTEFARQLEVFRGPGPVEYGSNAVHGLVNIQSQDVNIPTYIQLLGSDDGFAGVTAAHSIGEFRLAVTANHDNGFRDDSGFDQQKVQLKYQGALGGWDVDWLNSFQNLNQETAGFLQDIDGGPQGEELLRDPDTRFSNPNPEAFRDNKTFRTQASFARDIGEGTTLKLTPYARRVELEFLRHFVPGQALEENNHTSVGLQSALYSKDWSFGVDVEYTKGSLFEFQDNETVFSFTQGLHYDYEVDSFVGAVYGQKDFWLGPKTVLDIGARAEYTRYDYDNQTTTGSSGRFIRLADREDDFFVITPKVSLRHEINETLNIYARAARGARAPQSVDLYSVQLNQTGGEARTETLDSLETGIKYDDGTLSFEAAAFAQWKDNFFFRNSDGFNVANGQTKHIGVEGAFAARLTDWLSLSGDGTLARHTYDFDDLNVNADGSVDVANTITDGDRVDTAPDTLANVRLTVTPTARFSSEIEWRHVGSYFTDPGNTQSYDGHDIFVLRAAYDVTDNLRVFGRIDNLFDAIYADRADFAFGNERFSPGRPQTLFFGLTSEF
ncbi:MAG: TonB-dependent receptor [Litorimonas sp.]